MKKLSYVFYLVLAVFFTSCTDDNFAIESGKVKHIPFSSNYIIGTDSSIVVIDRDSGKIISVIDR